MTYRDDRDADRARIESLEAELAAANRRVSELEGKGSTALVKAADGAVALISKPGAARTWLGAPLELELKIELDGEYPTADFEDLIEPIREFARDSGRTEILKSSMTWSASTGPKSTGPFLVATITVRDGKTRIVVTDKLGQLAGAIHGGVGGGAGGGTVFFPIAIANTFLTPFLIPVLVVGWLGSAWLGTRAIYKRLVKRRAAKLQQLFDLLVDEVTRGIAKAKAS